jgi:hypothetical protein
MPRVEKCLQTVREMSLPKCCTAPRSWQCLFDNIVSCSRCIHDALCPTRMELMGQSRRHLHTTISRAGGEHPRAGVPWGAGLHAASVPSKRRHLSRSDGVEHCDRLIAAGRDQPGVRLITWRNNKELSTIWPSGNSKSDFRASQASLIGKAAAAHSQNGVELEDLATPASSIGRRWHCRALATAH